MTSQSVYSRVIAIISSLRFENCETDVCDQATDADVEGQGQGRMQPNRRLCPISNAHICQKSVVLICIRGCSFLPLVIKDFNIKTQQCNKCFVAIKKV